MTREVPLTRGVKALVDDEDYQRVMEAAPWHFSNCDGRLYASRSVRLAGHRRSTEVRLHSFLTGWPLVDHINGDSLDNRRSNLRSATAAQNSANSRLSARSTSGLKGVTWYKRTSRWRAHITVAQQQRHLGYFADARDAGRAYDLAAISEFGDFARTNFPRESYL